MGGVREICCGSMLTFVYRYFPLFWCMGIYSISYIYETNERTKDNLAQEISSATNTVEPPLTVTSTMATSIGLQGGRCEEV